MAEQFTPPGRVLDVRPYGNGNVHDTFLVTVRAPQNRTSSCNASITRVFHRPELVMANLRTCTEHVRRRLARPPRAPAAAGRCPGCCRPGTAGTISSTPRARSGGPSALLRPPRPSTSSKILEHAREVGYALGAFHQLLSDLPADGWPTPCPGFTSPRGTWRTMMRSWLKPGRAAIPGSDLLPEICGGAPGLGPCPGGGPGPGAAPAAADTRRSQGQQRPAGHRHRPGRGPGGPGHRQARSGAL